MKKAGAAVIEKIKHSRRIVLDFFKRENLEELYIATRKVCTFWVAELTLAQFEAIRAYELTVVLNLLPKKGRILEIGAGTGWQAEALHKHGYDVSAIDLTSSNYKDNRICEITEYDGKTIPFENNSFDVVFSSNTLEHIPHVEEFQKEIQRVLKPNGIALHVVPSSSWRFWTNITEFLKSWTISKAHGEHAPNSFKEIYYFSRKWWSQLFRKTGWSIVAKKSNRLFYTGCLIMDSRLNVSARHKLSFILGGSCNIFILRKEINSPSSK